MKVYVAVFGEENNLWPYCKEHGTVATINEAGVHPLWVAQDREAFILDRMRTRTSRGALATRPVASRWFNLMNIVTETAGDLWIHGDGERLWWTNSKEVPAYFENQIEPVGRRRKVVICHKPCKAWQCIDLKGNPLLWKLLHPKAKNILTVQSTLISLADNDADYARALIAGEPLAKWHELPEWRAKFEQAKSKQGDITYITGLEKAGYAIALELMPEKRMALTALSTTKTSNGQTVERTVKDKEFRFADWRELARYVSALIELQEQRCALTGLTMDYPEKGGNMEMFCSLDRVDSDGHYEEGNLQVVCRFANRWKGASDNDQFLRLMAAVRNVDVI